MPRYRVTFDVDADSVGYALGCITGFPGERRGINTIPDVLCMDELDGHSLHAPHSRAIIFYRRASVSTDTLGDFLPNTQPCDYDGGNGLEDCDQISTVLVSWSNGLEHRLCPAHMTEATGYELVDVREHEDV